MTVRKDRGSQPQVQPTRRNLKFQLPADRIADWHAGGPHVALFMDTLSIFFPAGERFFIDAVRQYRDRVTDPELKKAVTAFIGQEAMHTREHEAYNEALFAALPRARDMERFVVRFLAFLQRRTPNSARLSATIALEHFTAIMADGLLKNPALLEGCDERFAALWRWHALEETEHKAVAYDVWETVMGRGPRAYVERVGGLLAATLIFWSIALPFFVRLVQAQGRLTDLRGWRQWLRYSLTGHAFLTRLVPPWLDYFRPGFHPWDHDNRHFLEAVEALAAPYRAAA